MKKLIGLLLFGLLAIFTFAQEVPQAELYGGYSYLRAQTNINEIGVPSHLNLNGWNAALAFNINKNFGLMADFGGHYGSPVIYEPTGEKADVSIHSFLFGPRFTQRTDKLTVFAHALFGGARVKANLPTAVLNGTQLSAIEPMAIIVPFDGNSTDTGFSMAFGGGLDINVNKNFGFRIVQGDYLMTRAFNDTQNNFRIGAGIVFRVGGK